MMVEFQTLDGARMWVMVEDIISVREHVGKPATVTVRTHIQQRPVEIYDLLTEVNTLIDAVGRARHWAGR